MSKLFFYQNVFKMCYNKCILKLKNLGVSIENHRKAQQVDVEHLQKKNLENHANQTNIVTALQIDVERNLENHANQTNIVTALQVDVERNLKNHVNHQTNIVTALQVDVERKHLQQERLLKHIRIFHQRVG
jgi:hypothetical protein